MNFELFSLTQCRELVADLATLEATVCQLEQELLSLHFRLSQERNERRLAEYKVRHLSLQVINVNHRMFSLFLHTQVDIISSIGF